ncbi:hypothetical protein GTW08_08175, partial [Pseudonocardia sp. SID8383]|nr:hypothetical protein [Pseudonocardia sp. SID8383]
PAAPGAPAVATTPDGTAAPQAPADARTQDAPERTAPTRPSLWERLFGTTR